MPIATAFVATQRPQRLIRFGANDANSLAPGRRKLADLQLAAYGVQVATHLLTCRLTITAA